MKKIVLFLALSLCLTSVTKAQTLNIVNGKGNFKSTANHAVTDTISTGVTEYQYGIIDNYQDLVAVQPTFTKVSGTAGATAKLQGSVDGVSYNDVGTPSSYTVTDTATQSVLFTLTPSYYRFYRLSVVPSGTQVVKVVTPVIYKTKPLR